LLEVEFLVLIEEAVFPVLKDEVIQESKCMVK